MKNQVGQHIRVQLQYFDLNFSTNQWQWYYPTNQETVFELPPGKETFLRQDG